MNNLEVSNSLKRLLASSYVLYLKTQNFHWNVTGMQFTSLHLLFEQHYQDLAEAVDEIAERIRALGDFAPGSFSEFLELTELKEASGRYKAMDMVKQLYEDQLLISKECEKLIALCGDDDPATADLCTVRLQVHEKNKWMLASLLD